MTLFDCINVIKTGNSKDTVSPLVLNCSSLASEALAFNVLQHMT